MSRDNLRLLTQRMGESFSFDRRSLALFRIVLGVLLLRDLGARCADLTAFCTDAGVWPRSAQLELIGRNPYWSFHLLSGAWGFQLALFVGAIIFALMLLVGAQTQLATVASWILLVSVQNRNWIIINAGDHAFRLALFWAMFLPLGACYSVDFAWKVRGKDSRKGDEGNQKAKENISRSSQVPTLVLSAGTIGLTLQIAYVYFFSALAKTDASWTIDRTATYYSLRLEDYATPLGTWLTQFPVLLKILTAGVLKWEFWGPWLLLVFPARTFPRAILAFLFIGFHVCLESSIRVGLFSYVGMAFWLCLLPSAFWETATRHKWIRISSPICVYFDQECGFCRRVIALISELLQVPGEWFQPAQPEPAIFAAMREHNSWVVVDQNGTNHYGYDGFLEILSTRAFLYPLVRLMKLRPVQQLGARLYLLVSHHREGAARVLNLLPHRRPWARLPQYGQVLAGFFIIYTLLWNVRNVNPVVTRAVPAAFYSPVYLAFIRQRWGMFTPVPRTDGWYVIPARLRSGKKVDLFRQGQPLSWAKPASIMALFPDSRWRFFLLNWKIRSYRRFRSYYPEYLRSQWNSTHSRRDRIVQMRIYYMQETNLLDGSNSSPNPLLLWEKAYS